MRKENTLLWDRRAGDVSRALTETQRKEIIQKEREAYLKSEGDSYSWEEVKAMAINKPKRQLLQRI